MPKLAPMLLSDCHIALTFNTETMKTITAVTLVLAMALLPACECTTCRDGIDGLDGDSFLGSVFEIEGDFTAENNWTLYYDFPQTFKVYDSDVVLVYLLWEQTETEKGKTLDVWRLLPQTILLDEGVLQYNFDFTLVDVKVFLDGTVDLKTLLPAESLDQVFRIVVLPADFVVDLSLDVTDFGLVMKSLGKEEIPAGKMEGFKDLQTGQKIKEL